MTVYHEPFFFRSVCIWSERDPDGFSFNPYNLLMASFDLSSPIKYIELLVKYLSSFQVIAWHDDDTETPPHTPTTTQQSGKYSQFTNQDQFPLLIISSLNEKLLYISKGKRRSRKKGKLLLLLESFWWGFFLKWHRV